MRKLLAVPFLMLVVACQPAASPLTDQDVEALRALGQSYAEAVLTADVDGVVAAYSEDATELPPETSAVYGKEAIRANYEASFAGGPQADAFTLTAEEIEGVGGLAYDRGTWAWTSTPPGMTTPVTVTGKYVSIARQQVDGSWLWTDVIWNSDAPPPEPAPADPAEE